MVGVPQPSLRHRADQEAAVHRREDALEVADDARRVGDHVLREEDAVERAVAHAGAQRVEEDRAVEPDQPADADQREAEAELDRRELGRDEDQQREAGLAVGQLGVEDADRLDVDDALEAQLERPGVFALRDVEIEEAAAGEAAAVDDQADAVRRLEADGEIDGAEIAVLAREGEIGLEPDAVDRDGERTERRP